MTNDTETPTDGDQTQDTRSRSPGRPSGSVKQTKAGHRIELPDGDCLRPVLDLATEHRVSERTIKRKMHTVRHGGVHSHGGHRRRRRFGIDSAARISRNNPSRP